MRVRYFRLIVSLGAFLMSVAGASQANPSVRELCDQVRKRLGAN